MILSHFKLSTVQIESDWKVASDAQPFKNIPSYPYTVKFGNKLMECKDGEGSLQKYTQPGRHKILKATGPIMRSPERSKKAQVNAYV